MGQLSEEELKVFQIMVEEVKAGRAALLRVTVNDTPRAAIASYARVGGKGRLGVYGLMLSPAELEEIDKQLQKQEFIAPPQESAGRPEISPVPMPDDAQLDGFVSVAHEGYSLRDMCEKHLRRVDVSSQGSNSDESSDFEEFVNREDGQMYLAVTMMQLFRQDPGHVYSLGACPFCHGDIVDAEDGWRRCSTCGCSWSADGGFRKGTQEGGVQ